MFNQEGEFMLKFGSNGEGNGQFNAPTGVAVDSNGNIIVADWGNSRIQVTRNANVSVERDRYLLKVKNCLSPSRNVFHSSWVRFSIDDLISPEVLN